MQFKNVAMVSAAAVIVSIAIGAGGAYAATQIGSGDIKDNSVRSIDVKDGTLRVKDLRPHAVTRLQGQGAVRALADRVAALEANAADGSDLNTNWAPGEDGGTATIVSPNDVVLDAQDQGYSYASIKNLDLYVGADAHIQYTYKPSDGGHSDAGSPRLKVVINGVSYSSVNQVNPDYGHDNGDGTFTVDAVMTVLTDNSQGHNPAGTITRASLIHEGTGSVEFTNVSIDGQPISFQ